MESKAPVFLAREKLQSLFNALLDAGYSVFGPQVKEGAIVYERLTSLQQLPKGHSDSQTPGRYQLQKSDSERLFHWANGPQALKPLLFPAREVLWQAQRQADGQIEFIIPENSVEKIAVLGVKACDLAALRLQDKHFLEGEYVDPGYKARRQSMLLIGVDCSHAAETCFCASTGDGPEVTHSYDLVMSELDDGFLIGSGSPIGKELLAGLPLQMASDAQIIAARRQTEKTAAMQSRALNRISINQLQSKRTSPRWDDVADRCLACGNCTMVCPTCFCHHQKEVPDMSGDSSEHLREWDSCFGESHGQLAGFQVRASVKQRYQQWMIHKLDSWQEQYDSSGCVGCGRCLSWCPAEIDFVEEANLIGGEE